MITTTFKRVFKYGAIGFYRNRTISLSSIFVMVVTLFIIGIIFFAQGLLTHSLTLIEDKVDINVTFTTTASEDKIAELKHSLELLPEVDTVTYLSRDDVAAQFLQRHQDDSLVVQALREVGGNPFGAELQIKAKNPGQYESIAQFLKSDSGTLQDTPDFIDQINYYKNKEIIDRLVSFIDDVNKVAYTLAIFFVAVSIMITYNTMRLAIYVFRDEISVMRLVGADRMYVRGPFMVEGIIYGFVAAILTLIIFWPVTALMADRTREFFAGFDMVSYYFSHFIKLAFLSISIGVSLGAISSYLAVRKYLQR